MPSVSELSDGQLIEQSIDGSERAFREILSRYREKILAICLRMMRNRTEAEEAAQDSFVKIYLNLDRFDQTRDFGAWAAGIALNECRDCLRKRARSKKIFSELGDSDPAGSQAMADDNLERKLKMEAVENAIEKLPDKLREAIILRAYGDYSYEEIAKIMKIRVGTVMSRLYRAREQLTEILKQEIDK